MCRFCKFFILVRLRFHCISPWLWPFFNGPRLECVKCSSEAMLYIASELRALAPQAMSERFRVPLDPLVNLYIYIKIIQGESSLIVIQLLSFIHLIVHLFSRDPVLMPMEWQSLRYWGIPYFQTSPLKSRVIIWMNWNDFNVMSLERWLASTFMPNWHCFIYFQDLSGLWIIVAIQSKVWLASTMVST